MNCTTFKYYLSRSLFLLLLVSLFCCNGSGDGKTTGETVKGIFGKNALPQAETDSLYIQEYISKEKEFKEHEELMFLFYGDRNYKLAWFRDNKLVPESEKLVETLNNATREGLNPQQYKLVNFEEMFERYQNLAPDDSARLKLQQDIDIALTASYFNYASDFYRGRLAPENQKKVNWNVRKNKIKLHKALQTILQERESTYPYYEFEALHEGYSKLRDALARYRDIEASGGWPQVELGNRKALQKGDTAEAVLALRKRLNPDKNFAANDERLRVYDENLEKQVKEFQALHGLSTDGIVGGNTLRMMNVPVEDRIAQIIINMERWRWIPKRMVPKSLDQRFIFVNIPEYKLYVYEDPDNDPTANRSYKKVMEMRVIVGKELNSTPIFSDKMEYVVMAPYWNVPNSIVANEIKPNMLRNPNWLATQNMEIVTKERNPRQVSPSSINWANVTEENFQYMVRQKPGPKNSLGQIKFLFPNQYAVYLHDTPADALFDQTERGFSHGCVRVEKPVELAKYLMRGMPEWNENTIRRAMNGNEEEWVTLPKKVQVYLVYFTSWVDEEGRIHFRDDIYGHDKKLQNEYFS